MTKTASSSTARKLQTWYTEDLIAAIACTTRGSWLAKEMANELAGRGVNHEGRWIGFPEARALWVDADR